MKFTTISSDLFVVSGASRSDAERQMPNHSQWGIEPIYETPYGVSPLETQAYAIYRKEFFPEPNHEYSHLALVMQLQWMYDHAKELQVKE